jgi:hypothetical protein
MVHDGVLMGHGHVETIKLKGIACHPMGQLVFSNFNAAVAQELGIFQFSP